MTYKIVSDSSSNIFTWDKIPYATVPLKILSSEKEYVDNSSLDVAGMVEDLKTVKGATKTACPSTGEWLDAFEGADCIFAITLTSNLSGCYNSACIARDQYIEEHPASKVHVVDSLSTGGEMHLIIEKITELIEMGKEFEEIVKEIEEYKDTTRLIFSLQSLTNLARNGRVSPAVAAIAGVLGIRVVGSATDGRLDPTDKVRGEKKALSTIYANMKKCGYKGGKVRINHCLNPESAETLKEKILSEYPNADVSIVSCTALCSFYAEAGGLIIGYEGANKH
ncbi:MAG: DegV family protein [Clostridia bacterium]|nr:DegV family protein [Clostridia bacterium]